jgi:endonuclease G, mitochondrial
MREATGPRRVPPATIVFLAVGLALGLWSDGARGDQAAAGCTNHFFERELPQLRDQARADGTEVLCFSEFAVLHSRVTKTPLWSAEHLTSARIDAARSGGKRPGNFHQESMLPRAERAKVSDYKSASNEFDIGHMAPSGDMSTSEARWESFSLANVVPQHACNNEELWEGIERAVREFAEDEDEIFVFTGPVYPDMRNARTIGDGVAVPDQIFKAIYLPANDEAAAYIVLNQDTHRYRMIGIAELSALTGIDFFPRMTERARSTRMSLPPAKRPRFRCRLR